MADNAPRLHLICYDITNPRRLSRVHRCLVRHGLPLQYSVFLVYAHKAGLQAILAEVRALIDHRKDDVRAYPLPRDAEYQHLGRQVFPEGVTVAGRGLNEQMFFSKSGPARKSGELQVMKLSFCETVIVANRLYRFLFDRRKIARAVRYRDPK